MRPATHREGLPVCGGELSLYAAGHKLTQPSIPPGYVNRVSAYLTGVKWPTDGHPSKY